jgi:PAS domain S-box-containing protein
MSRDEPGTRAQSLGAAALTLLLEQMPDAALCLLDSAGVIEEWHASAEMLLGHIASQVQGQRLETLLPEERRFEAELPRALFEASAQGRGRLEAALMTRTGQRRVCVMDLSPRLDGNDDVAGFIVLLRATGPRRAADTVTANENLVAAHRLNLTRATDDPAWVGIDLVGRVSGLGEGAARWLGCDVEDTLGRGIDACIELRESGSWPVVLHRAVRSRGAISLSVAPVDGEQAPQRTARLLPLRAADGRLNGFTLLVEADSPVAASAPAESPTMSPRTPLDRASDRAGVLAAAHDLREPLRKMQHNARQLQAAEAPRLTDNGRRQLESLQSAAERMQGMIGGMLRLARIDTGNVDIEPQDLNEVLDEVRTDLAVLVEEHGASFDIGNLGKITGDGAHLRALFQNLIDNSIRYRRPGVAPYIRIAPIAAENASPGVRIRYEDNGRGLDDPDAAFQPFRRNGASDRGTGIGLSLCQRICRRHGGDLTVAQTGEAGTEFLIEIDDLADETTADA